MTLEMGEFHHPDSIWTWKHSDRGKKASLWIPYMKSVSKAVNCPRDHYEFSYNGGAFISDLSKVDCIMLYGPTGDLSIEFLDRLSVNGTVLLVHRRNISKPYIFLPGYGAPTSDILTQQVLARENQVKCVYVAKTLISSRLKSFHHLTPISTSTMKRLRGLRNLVQVRAMEAQATKKYWAKYYRALGVEGLTRRDNDHALNGALNAGSFFLFGLILRWVLLHRLSPWHGFMHQPVNYASLCYDLMEPYRYIIEAATAKCWLAQGCEQTGKEFTARVLSEIKSSLKETVYVAETRQYIDRKNLLHGAVLALRSYLSSETKRLILPTEGEKSVGRPPKVGYSIPGERRL